MGRISYQCHLSNKFIDITEPRCRVYVSRQLSILNYQDLCDSVRASLPLTRPSIHIWRGILCLMCTYIPSLERTEGKTNDDNLPHNVCIYIFSVFCLDRTNYFAFNNYFVICGPSSLWYLHFILAFTVWVEFCLAHHMLFFLLFYMIHFFFNNYYTNFL